MQLRGPQDQSYGPTGQGGQARRPQRDRRRQGERGLDREPDRLQLPRRGNQIWWNGGDGSGHIGMGAWYGNYLSATTTFYRADKPQASYGEFASNARGPGRLAHSYASNMNDAGVYIGACQQVCHSVRHRLALPVQRPRLLGDQRRRPAGAEELRVGPQRERHRHQQPEQRRRPLTAGRRLPERRHRAHGHLLLHVHQEQLRPRQQQQPHPADDAIPVRDRDRDRRRSRRHGDRQQGHAQRRLGDPPRPLPRLRPAAADRPLRGRHPRRARARARASTTTGATRSSTTSLSAERLLRQPHERRPRRAVERGADRVQQLLVRQQASGRRALRPPTPRICRPFTARPSAGSHKPRRTAARSPARPAATRGCSPAIPSMHYPNHGRVVIHKLPPQPSMPNPCAGVPANPWCPSNASGHRRR